MNSAFNSAQFFLLLAFSITTVSKLLAAEMSCRFNVFLESGRSNNPPALLADVPASMEEKMTPDNE